MIMRYTRLAVAVLFPCPCTCRPRPCLRLPFVLLATAACMLMAGCPVALSASDINQAGGSSTHEHVHGGGRLWHDAIAAKVHSTRVEVLFVGQVVVDVFFRIQYLRHILLGRFSNVAFKETASYEAAITHARHGVVGSGFACRAVANTKTGGVCRGAETTNKCTAVVCRRRTSQPVPTMRQCDQRLSQLTTFFCVTR